MFKLSIAIPTFNRASYLSVTLDCIISQIKGFEDNVQIVISDNCSTDNTKEIVESKLYKNIKYHKQDSNIGFMKNFEALSNLVNAEYTWYLGDDDLPVSGSIKKLLDVIDDSNYSIVYLNHQPFECRNTKEKMHKQEDEDIIFKDGKELFRYANVGLQFISSVVVRTEYMISAVEKYKNLFDKESHILEFMDVARRGSGYFIAIPMTYVGYNDQNLDRGSYSDTYFVKKTNWVEIFFIYPQKIFEYAIKNLDYQDSHIELFKKYNDYQFFRTYSCKKKDRNRIDYMFIKYRDGVNIIYSLKYKILFSIIYITPAGVIKHLWNFGKVIFGQK